ncbi:hypothetical protein TNCV_2766431 [Trichonephila clavipes]|nr:hypothetical protein TNCV_2766431 [Trichonephila clavipes]
MATYRYKSSGHDHEPHVRIPIRLRNHRIEVASVLSEVFKLSLLSALSRAFETTWAQWPSGSVSRFHTTGPEFYPLAGYTRAFGDGPRNFEPWSDVDDKEHHTKSTDLKIEPMTKQATFRYQYHSATAATCDV